MSLISPQYGGAFFQATLDDLSKIRPKAQFREKLAQLRGVVGMGQTAYVVGTTEYDQQFNVVPVL
eukprot:gene44708-47249_t